MVSSHAVDPEPLIAPMVALLASNDAEVKRRVCDFICIAAEVDSEVRTLRRRWMCRAWDFREFLPLYVSLEGLSKAVLHQDSRLIKYFCCRDGHIFKKVI